MNEFLPQLIQQLFNGLSLGAIYALIAIGYTMVYGIIGMINFAHGEDLHDRWLRGSGDPLGRGHAKRPADLDGDWPHAGRCRLYYRFVRFCH